MYNYVIGVDKLDNERQKVKVTHAFTLSTKC